MKFDTDEEREDFFKTRVEYLGLSRKITGGLIKAGIRTAGGILSRSPKELRKVLKLAKNEMTSLINGVERAAQESSVNFKEMITRVVEEPAPSPILSLELETETRLSLPEEKDIVETLCNYFGADKKDIVDRNRRKEAVRVRDLVVYLLREYGGMSYPSIGQLLGGRDHTTIIHAYRKTKKDMDEHPELKAGLVSLINKVKEIKERKLRLEKDLLPEITALVKTGGRSSFFEPRFREIPKRDLEILNLYRDGLTLQNIANLFGVSRERIRQIAFGTIKQMATNDSITTGVTMDSATLVEEESKNRKAAQEAQLNKQKPLPKEKRWSTYYTACRSCGTTSIPHVKKGLCEQCIGQFRGDRRAQILEQHGNRCDSCGKNQYETAASYGRGFYITKAKEVLCRGCFLKKTGTSLGHYKNYTWSRFYPECKSCGTTSIPHAQSGFCEKCSKLLTNELRERIISQHGEKCDSCNIQRTEAKLKLKRDFFITKSQEVLCKKCFHKQPARWKKLTATKSAKRTGKLQP